MQNGSDSGFYSPARAAQALGLSKRRVLQMLTSNPPELAGMKDDKGRWLIARADLFDLLERREREQRERSGPRPDATPAQDRELVEALRDEIAHLRRESERKDTIIMSLANANAEQARTIRAIEPHNSVREWAVDEEVSREDAGMQGRPNVSDEQKHYERYDRPYEAAESTSSPGPSPAPTEPPAGPQEATSKPSEYGRPSLRRRILGFLRKP